MKKTTIKESLAIKVPDDVFREKVKPIIHVHANGSPVEFSATEIVKSGRLVQMIGSIDNDTQISVVVDLELKSAGPVVVLTLVNVNISASYRRLEVLGDDAHEVELNVQELALAATSSSFDYYDSNDIQE